MAHVTPPAPPNLMEHSKLLDGQFFPRPMPPGLEGLAELAIDLRWTWSHASDQLWAIVDRENWEATQNPWVVLQNLTDRWLAELASNASFRAELERVTQARAEYMRDPGWYGRQHPGEPLRAAYFSMEFGLGEALPLYAGGLGVLSGDFLKTASDLGIPLAGIGLLFHEGYFRQVIDADGRQSEAFPFNDPLSMPVFPVRDRDGAWLRVSIELPGRALSLRLWQVQVGRASLYLLDSNDPRNSAVDRGITSKLYDGDPERRLQQEIVLGIGGWRAIEALGLEIDVCHINEGHAGFAVLERARSFMLATGVAFEEALFATRAGNVSTTHTPVAAGFDHFPPAMIIRYFSDYADALQITMADLLALGRVVQNDENEPFTTPYLAGRGSGWINGVSRLHRAVTRRIVAPSFPRWPECEVPIDSVTNGVHAASWDSAQADELWTRACGKGRWLGTLEEICDRFACSGDEEIWTMRQRSRAHLVEFVREHLARQLGERGADPEEIEQAAMALDPGTLTLGFARRFASYKRPDLILADAARLKRILVDYRRPVQIVVAGKAHPLDAAGKQLVEKLASFARGPEIRNRFVFLADYDMTIAQHMVQGVDVWINTPRRPWEACGTSGMKVLVNGGLNFSELDGWWAEAYQPELGWALGDGREHDTDPAWDAHESAELYRALEDAIAPEFYDRDAGGIPRRWIARIRASMSRLTPEYSSNRMLREYVERAYLPAAAGLRRRRANGAAIAHELNAWNARVRGEWRHVRFHEMSIETRAAEHHFRVRVGLGELQPEDVCLELYADPAAPGADPERITMSRTGSPAGAPNHHQYEATVATARPAEHYTPRVRPYHPDAILPLENALILWLK